MYFRTPLVWSPAFRRPGPAKAGTPNGRFMESRHSFFRMHWDHEPTPSPSQEGSESPVPLLGGVRGGLVGARFMERGALRFFACIGTMNLCGAIVARASRRRLARVVNSRAGRPCHYASVHGKPVNLPLTPLRYSRTRSLARGHVPRRPCVHQVS